MGFLEILTLVFIVLKVLNIVTWSWWLVLSPEIIAFVLYGIMIIGMLFGVNKSRKHVKKTFDKFDF